MTLRVLAPEAVELLRRLDGMGARPYPELGVLRARTAVESSRWMQGPKIDGVAVREILVESGRLPARVYRAEPGRAGSGRAGSGRAGSGRAEPDRAGRRVRPVARRGSGLRPPARRARAGVASMVHGFLWMSGELPQAAELVTWVAGECALAGREVTS